MVEVHGVLAAVWIRGVTHVKENGVERVSRTGFDVHATTVGRAHERDKGLGLGRVCVGDIAVPVVGVHGRGNVTVGVDVALGRYSGPDPMSQSQMRAVAHPQLRHAVDCTSDSSATCHVTWPHGQGLVWTLRAAHEIALQQPGGLVDHCA